MKKCSKCKIEKDEDEFYKATRERDKLTGRCKLCTKYRHHEYYIKNKKEIRKKNKIYNIKNKTKRKEHSKEYSLTLKGRYQTYKGGSKTRNIKFELTLDEFATFWHKDCYYCGDKIGTIGLDRKNNKKGYEMGNVRACCGHCDYMKMDWTEKEFIEHCKKVVDKFYK